MDADARAFGGQVGAVHHCSKRVHCAACGQPAVVSVIERSDTNGAVCFVLWCSLRAAGECDEQCLKSAGAQVRCGGMIEPGTTMRVCVAADVASGP